MVADIFTFWAKSHVSVWGGGDRKKGCLFGGKVYPLNSEPTHAHLMYNTTEFQVGGTELRGPE